MTDTSDFPTLRRGSSGPWVDYLQQLTPLVNDGDFGPDTEAAVKNFQQNQGLTPDGVVGPQTWEALLTYQKPEPPPPPQPGPGELPIEIQNGIRDIAANSDIAGYNWISRGRAPSGYTEGVALAFATSYLRIKANDSIGIEMGKANTHNADKDALSWYKGKFDQWDMDNSVAGPDTLRHLYVLVLGLGMRESSGKHCEGRDMSASNTTSDTCEAGAWQTSYNAHTCSDEFDKLFDQANEGTSPCYLSTFEQGVSCSSSSWSCYGSGNGYRFQELCKSCPVFAAETCAVTLRNLRQHYGPINRYEAEVRPEADTMLRQVQSYLDEMEAVA